MPQGKFISKNELKEILQRAPQGSNPKQVLKGLLDRGFDIEGLNTAPEVSVEQPELAQPQEKKGFLSNLKDSGFVQTISSAFSGANPLARVGQLLPQKRGEERADAGKEVFRKTARAIAPLGETLGDAAATPFVLKQEREAQQQSSAMRETIADRARLTTDPVKKQRLLDLLNRQETPQFASQAAPSLDKSNLQIAGEGIVTGLSALAGGSPSFVANAAPGATQGATNAAKFLTQERMTRLAVNTARGSIGGLGSSLQTGDDELEEILPDVGMGAALAFFTSAAFEALDVRAQRRLLKLNDPQSKPGKVFAEQLKLNKRKLASDIKRNAPDLGDDIARDPARYQGTFADMQQQAQAVQKETWGRLEGTLKQVSGVQQADDLIIPTVDVRQSLNFQGGVFAEMTPDQLFDDGLRLKPQVADHAIKDIAGKFRLRFGGDMADDMLALVDKVDDLTIDQIDDHAAKVIEKSGIPLIKRDDLLTEMTKRFQFDPTDTITVQQHAGLKEAIMQRPRYMTLWEANNLKKNLYDTINPNYWMLKVDGSPASMTFSGDTRVAQARWLRKAVEEKAGGLDSSLSSIIRDNNKRYGVATEVLNSTVMRQAEQRTASRIQDFTVSWKRALTDFFKQFTGGEASRTKVAQWMQDYAGRSSFGSMVLETPLLMNMFIDTVGRGPAVIDDE